MKKLLAKLVLISLLVVLIAPFSVGIARAEEPAVPDTFKVNEILKLEDQKSYVPSKEDAANTADPTKSSGVVIILLKAIDLFVKIIGSIALIVFILGAILTITSEGKEDRLEKGKTAMVYALIGLVITFFSFIIVAFVQSILF